MMTRDTGRVVGAYTRDFAAYADIRTGQMDCNAMANVCSAADSVTGPGCAWNSVMNLMTMPVRVMFGSPAISQMSSPWYAREFAWSGVATSGCCRAMAGCPPW